MYEVAGVANNVPADPVGYTVDNNLVDVSVVYWCVATVFLTLWFVLVATVLYLC